MFVQSMNWQRAHLLLLKTEVNRYLSVFYHGWWTRGMCRYSKGLYSLIQFDRIEFGWSNNLKWSKNMPWHTRKKHICERWTLYVITCIIHMSMIVSIALANSNKSEILKGGNTRTVSFDPQPPLITTEQSIKSTAWSSRPRHIEST